MACPCHRRSFSTSFARTAEASPLELALRRSLLRAHASYHDLSLVVVFRLHRLSRQSPQYDDLANMSERVGNRSLKEIFQRGLHGFFRSQVIIELFQRREETLDFLLPRQGLGVMPFAFSIRHREPPIHQVAHVRQNLPWCSHSLIHMEYGEALGRVADGLASAISERSQGVTQQFALRICIGMIAHKVPPGSRFSVLGSQFSALSSQFSRSDLQVYNFLRPTTPIAFRAPRRRVARPRANCMSRKPSMCCKKFLP